jgi:hypothetical protein
LYSDQYYKRAVFDGPFSFTHRDYACIYCP